MSRLFSTIVSIIIILLSGEGKFLSVTRIHSVSLVTLLHLYVLPCTVLYDKKRGWCSTCCCFLLRLSWVTSLAALNEGMRIEAERQRLNSQQRVTLASIQRPALCPSLTDIASFSEPCQCRDDIYTCVMLSNWVCQWLFSFCNSHVYSGC